jgi:hypothetical protein
MSSQLNIKGGVNVDGVLIVNGVDIANEVRGVLNFSDEDDSVRGSIIGDEDDGVEMLRIRSEKVIIDGDLKVTGTLSVGEGITTEEQATGEKFFGRDVFVKGWEGPLNSTDWQTTIPNFFPSSSCHIVSYGGESNLAGSDEYYPLPCYLSTGRQRLVRRIARVWVKYTKS